MVLYFAYGSNMDEAKLRSRAPTAQRPRLARLDGYRLAFTRKSVATNGGVADILAAPGFSTFGAAFDVDEADLESLDRAEGVHLGLQAYRRHPVRIRLREEKEPKEAVTYTVVSPTSDEIVPQSEYLDAMMRALQAMRATEVAATSEDAIWVIRLGSYIEFLRWLRRTCGADDPQRAGTTFERPGLPEGTTAIVGHERMVPSSSA